jgi:processive 1,2-diacylglycerol beta-glucosyltransferase
MTRRILLASLNAGGGHHALRDSFAAALARVDPDRQRFDPVVWTSADRFIDWFYSVCVRFLPRFQGKIVELSGQPWALKTAMALSPQLRTEALALLRQQSFDLMVTTHPMQSMTFAQARRELGLATSLVLAVPDYGVPATGYHPPLPPLRSDALVVMEESTLEHYRSLGVPDDRLHLSGFLTREPFVRVGARLRAEGRDTARAALKAEVVAAQPDFARFDLSRPALLFLGGSAWTAKTAPVLEAVLADPAVRDAASVVVVAGRDPAFEARLRARAGDGVHVFGFVAPEVLAALMGLAEVPVLGSLAPATLPELLEVGLGPLLLFHFIPGSERAHVGYIDGQRLGLYSPDTDEMLRRIREVLGIEAPSDQLARARDGFRERARLLRSRSVERALQLPRFLERMLETPQVSHRGARAVG